MQEYLNNPSVIENEMKIFDNSEITKLIITGDVDNLKRYFEKIQNSLDSINERSSDEISEILKLNLKQVIKLGDDFNDEEDYSNSLAIYLNSLNYVDKV